MAVYKSNGKFELSKELLKTKQTACLKTISANQDEIQHL